MNPIRVIPCQMRPCFPLTPSDFFSDSAQLYNLIRSIGQAFFYIRLCENFKKLVFFNSGSTIIIFISFLLSFCSYPWLVWALVRSADSVCALLVVVLQVVSARFPFQASRAIRGTR